MASHSVVGVTPVCVFSLKLSHWVLLSFCTVCLFAEFVVIGFGLFFVFSEKQLPDKKMRNFRKTVVKPASIVNKRLSSVSSRGESIVTSTQVTAVGVDRV